MKENRLIFFWGVPTLGQSPDSGSNDKDPNPNKAIEAIKKGWEAHRKAFADKIALADTNGQNQSEIILSQIADILKQESKLEVTNEEIREAAYNYALGKYRNGKANEKSKKILKAIIKHKDILEAHGIKIAFSAGTDGTEHELVKNKQWHKEKAAALHTLLLANNLTLNNFTLDGPTRELINEYCTAVENSGDYQKIITDNRDKFLNGGGIFDAGLNIQRATDMKQRIFGKKAQLDKDSDNLTLDFGTTKDKLEERKSGVTFSLAEKPEVTPRLDADLIIDGMKISIYPSKKVFEVVPPKGREVVLKQVNVNKVQFIISTYVIGDVEFNEKGVPSTATTLGEKYDIDTEDGKILILHRDVDDAGIVDDLKHIKDWGGKDKNNFEYSGRFARIQKGNEYEYYIKEDGKKDYRKLGKAEAPAPKPIEYDYKLDGSKLTLKYTNAKGEAKESFYTIEIPAGVSMQIGANNGDQFIEFQDGEKKGLLEFNVANGQLQHKPKPGAKEQFFEFYNASKPEKGVIKITKKSEAPKPAPAPAPEEIPTDHTYEIKGNKLLVKFLGEEKKPPTEYILDIPEKVELSTYKSKEGDTFILVSSEFESKFITGHLEFDTTTRELKFGPKDKDSIWNKYEINLTGNTIKISKKAEAPAPAPNPPVAPPPAPPVKPAPKPAPLPIAPDVAPSIPEEDPPEKKQGQSGYEYQEKVFTPWAKQQMEKNRHAVTRMGLSTGPDEESDFDKYFKNKKKYVKELDKFIAKKGLAIVEFSANDCGPCQYLKPLFYQQAGRGYTHNGEKMRFGNFNQASYGEEFPGSKFGFSGYPAILIFKDGKVIAKFFGRSDNRKKLEERIKKILAKSDKNPGQVAEEEDI